MVYPGQVGNPMDYNMAQYGMHPQRNMMPRDQYYQQGSMPIGQEGLPPGTAPGSMGLQQMVG